MMSMESQLPWGFYILQHIRWIMFPDIHRYFFSDNQWSINHKISLIKPANGISTGFEWRGGCYSFWFLRILWFLVWLWFDEYGIFSHPWVWVSTYWCCIWFIQWLNIAAKQGWMASGFGNVPMWIGVKSVPSSVGTAYIFPKQWLTHSIHIIVWGNQISKEDFHLHRTAGPLHPA